MGIGHNKNVAYCSIPSIVRQVSSQVSVLQQNTNALQQLQFMKVATEPDDLFGNAWTLLRSAAVEIMLMGQ